MPSKMLPRVRRGLAARTLATISLAAACADGSATGESQPHGRAATEVNTSRSEQTALLSPDGTLSGQVEEWSEPAGELRALVSGELLVDGAIDTDGSFEIVLPAADEIEPYLVELPGELCTEGSGSIEVDPPGLLVGGPVYLLFFTGSAEEASGIFVQGHASQTDDEVEGSTVDFVFAAEAGSIRGTCETESQEGQVVTTTFDLALEAGWNAVLSALPPTPVAAEAVEFVVSTDEAAADEPWVFVPFEEVETADALAARLEQRGGALAPLGRRAR